MIYIMLWLTNGLIQLKSIQNQHLENRVVTVYFNLSRSLVHVTSLVEVIHKQVLH